MKLFFPRYIHGMLRSPSKENVFGDLRPIAYSKDFLNHLQSEVYQKVRPGINRNMLGEVGTAYGFFALNDSEFIAAHYELMDLTESNSRGKPIFSEYIYITYSQLSELNWNLYPIFKSFGPISYYDQITKDLDPLIYEDTNNFDWFDAVRPNSVQIEAILVRFLSSNEKVNILSKHIDPNFRLIILCSILHCLPETYRKNVSFATIASDTSVSQRIFFAYKQSAYGQVMDWDAPNIPSLNGIIYSNWVASLIGEGKYQDLAKEISSLRLPIQNKLQGKKTDGENLDLAMRHKEWYENRNIYLNVKVYEQLHQLLDQIKEFSCIYSDEEVGEWLSKILTFVMRLNAYDIGTDALSSYRALLLEKGIRQQLVFQIVKEAFLEQPEERINALADFMFNVTNFSISTNQSVLIEFCKDILTACLASKEYRKGFLLWKNLQHLKWISSSDWFVNALSVVPPLNSIQDVFFIINVLGCPVNQDSFTSLLSLLQRSPKIAPLLPKNIKFLTLFKNISVDDYFSILQECYNEVKSPRWFITQLQWFDFARPNSASIQADFIRKLTYVDVENLIDCSITFNYSRQTVLFAFSQILRLVYQIHTSDYALFDKYLVSCQQCKTEDIENGIAVLSKKTHDFPYNFLYQLLLMLNSKSGGSLNNYPNIKSFINEVTWLIGHYDRIKNIEKRFLSKIESYEIGWITRQFIPEFIQTGDINAWLLLVNLISERGFLAEYQKAMKYVALGYQPIISKNNQLQSLISGLENKNLTYETDLFVYKLISSGDSTIYPFTTILRTLNKNSVNANDAGTIIGFERSQDRKYITSLAKRMVKLDRSNALLLLDKLNLFVLEHPYSIISMRLKHVIGDISPDIIWTIFCRYLSTCIRSETRR